MTRKIKIVQFGFEVYGDGGGGDAGQINSIDVDSLLWALGGDGKLYQWSEAAEKWKLRHDCIEMEDDKQD